MLSVAAAGQDIVGCGISQYLGSRASLQWTSDVSLYSMFSAMLSEDVKLHLLSVSARFKC